jgi:hypothetical protein
MIQLQGQYERHEVQAAFARVSGSKQWPSADPRDSPLDRFICRACGQELSLLMYGASAHGDLSFEERALVILAEHLNIKHPRA